VTGLVTLASLFVLLVAGGVGFPIPEDVTLVGGGLLVRSGSVGMWQVVVVGVAAVCLADWILYLAGRRYGAGVVRHPMLARVLRREHVDAVEALVRRHGAWGVFLARFVLGTRIATFFSAGTFGVPAPAFAVAEGAGAVLFVSAMVTLGYLFAHQAARVAAGVGHVEHWLVLGGLAAIIAGLVGRAIVERSGSASTRAPDE
jgi:membrane protein DedA with SNARE-associated domain